MRRSASEIINNLESRVARLERKARKNPNWKRSLSWIVDYFDTNVGKHFRGSDFEIDTREPSSNPKLRGNENTATLVFILNNEAVYLEAYEQLNMFGRPAFGFYLMDGESNRILQEQKAGEITDAKPLIPAIVKLLQQFKAEEVDHASVLNNLHTVLQDDYIDANKVASLLKQIFTGSDLKKSFELAKATQGSDPYLGAKSLWEDFIVPKMRDQIREARIPTRL